MDETLEYIHSFPRFTGHSGIKPGLERMEALLERMGHPHRLLRFFHVAGTNGKGSTCAFLAGMLRACGQRVGVYTSPYLSHFSDRMSVNGREIDAKTLQTLVEEVKPHIAEVSRTKAGMPTQFEVITLLAILYFSREKVDWVVWETGLGGRLDATNVVTPQVSLITNVALDHTQILGTTIPAIAREKAGIIKQGVPVVTAAEGEALAVIQEKAQKEGSPLYVYGRDFFSQRKAGGWEGQRMVYHGLQRHRQTFSLSLLGAHQCVNASVAVAAMEVLAQQGMVPLDWEAWTRGVAQTRWPGRLELVRQTPRLLLDGAHNPHGAQALAKALQELVQGQRLIVVFGVLADKEVAGVIQPWLPLADTVIITEPDNPRRAKAEEVGQVIRRLSEAEAGKGGPRQVLVERKVERACDLALSLAQPGDVILVTGSLFTISQARIFLAG